ncbi:MAG: DHH family phosphoesterase [Oscillospiraceae bacterium]|jgi:phosphoesterase RecJ-like protein|nr:DHH family phosphoesterase [Oscillospiraceae bacterium]
MKSKLTLEEAACFLKEHDKFLIISHASPDGDTLGCGFALCRSLQQYGKEARCFCPDKLSDSFRFLSEYVAQQDFTPETIVTVDVAALPLLGDYESKYEGKIDLAIDHHSSNTGYAANSFVEKAGAAAEVVYRVLKAGNLPIDREIAEGLYVGIATDTGCFKYSSTTPQTHIIAAELMAYGFDYGKLNYDFFDKRTKSRIELESRVLRKVEFYFGGRCAVAILDKDDIENANDDDINCVSGLTRQIDGVDIGVTLKWKSDGVWKASVRTTAGIKAGDICAAHGGGGHEAAAGCKLHGTLDECKKKLIETIGAYV